MKVKNAKLLITFVTLFISLISSAQNYQFVYWDNYADGDSAVYCPCDSISCIPPTGATSVSWHLSQPAYPHTYHGDTLVLVSGYTGLAACISSVNNNQLMFFSINPPVAPVLPAIDTICGIETRILDAGNFSQYGFTNYIWSTGATSQTITVGAGNYSVTVSNACGTETASTSIININHHKPDLGPDITTCLGNQVQLDPGTGYNNYLWLLFTPSYPNGLPIGIDSSLAGSYNDFVLAGLNSASGTIAVITTNADDGCQDRDSIVVTFLLPPTHTICYVEFDTTTQKNKVIWAAPPANAQDIVIYREVSTNVWDSIGTVPASQTSFVDMTSNPENMSYSYKIAVLDTCINEGDMSDFHKTITLLSAYDQPTNTYGLTWSAYVGLTVPNYLIFGIDSIGQSTQIGSVPGNTYFYNYTNPSPAYKKYFVGFQTQSCGGKINYIVRSNYVASVTSGINDIENRIFVFYPNPCHDFIRIDETFGGFIRIFDIAGRQIYEHANTDGLINLSTLSRGCYLLELQTDKFITKSRLIKE